jgi:DNA-binding Lrp family transcriptional regulator
MNERTGELPTSVEHRLERAIILQLLGEEGERRSSQERLALALGIEAQALRQALKRLSDAGVVCLAGTEVWASAAARRIDELGLIAI